MASRRKSDPQQPIADDLLGTPETSLLDLLDRVLSKGVMAHGDLTLGVAGVDLVYIRLAALICAADRVLGSGRLAPSSKPRPQSRSRTRRR